ncbi:MAG: magnesium and cobalt transport protein CorA [Acidobacteria bacterium]|nr:MAG: magnesium and cobalt transport protein CorA [Acidobacteriota bacterium]
MSEAITQPATETVTSLRTLVDTPGLLWLDLGDPMSHELDDLAARYGFHELAVEDCRHQLQLAKLDYYEGYSFLIINSTHYSEKPCEVNVREIDAFIGGDYIVTVHDGPSRAIDEIEKRLVLNARHFERPDQVLHSIIDIVVDRYLPTLDHIGDTIDKVEDALLINPDITLLETIFDLKRGLLQFRRAVAAQRELLNMLIRDDTPFIQQEMRIYFRDVYDHAVRAMDLVETYRDLLTGGLDIYLTQMANRTNDVVKGLTILATVMLPLTLITGYFGMNFEYIPMLKDPNAIWYATGGMLIVAVSMLIFFKRKKWL